MSGPVPFWMNLNDFYAVVPRSSSYRLQYYKCQEIVLAYPYWVDLACTQGANYVSVNVIRFF